MAYATIDQLRLALRVTEAWTAEQEAQAQQLLDLAAAPVEAVTRQPLPLSTDTVTLDVPGDQDRPHTGVRRLVLPRWPVTSVTTVTLLRHDEDDEVLTHGTDYTWSAAGILTRRGAWWPPGDQTVEVLYAPGWDPVPVQANAAVLRIVAAAWDLVRPGTDAGLTQETLGDWSRSWAAIKDRIGAQELTPAEIRALSYYTART
jgi:hypothetical protein